MGVVSHRAGSAREASRVIESTPIHVAVVDLGLPMDASADACTDAQGCGPRLLDILARLAEPPPTVVIRRSLGHRDACRETAAALKMGAFSVLDRPRRLDDLNLMLEVLRRCLARHYRGLWPGAF